MENGILQLADSDSFLLEIRTKEDFGHLKIEKESFSMGGKMYDFKSCSSDSAIKTAEELLKFSATLPDALSVIPSKKSISDKSFVVSSPISSSSISESVPGSLLYFLVFTFTFFFHFL